MDGEREHSRLYPETPRSKSDEYGQPYVSAPGKSVIDPALQLIDVANGLGYLHRIDQIHGNLRGVSSRRTRRGASCAEHQLQANVLMSSGEPPRARLADFGLNLVMFDVFSMTKASVYWTAPEIFAPGDCDFKPTFASDIYALGMLIYEVTYPVCPFRLRILTLYSW